MVRSHSADQLRHRGKETQNTLLADTWHWTVIKVELPSLSLPQPDDCRIWNDTSYYRTENNPPHTHTHKTTGATISNESTTTERTAVIWASGGLKIILLSKIFALDSAVVKTENVLSSRRGFQTYPMYRHGETINLYTVMKQSNWLSNLGG